MKKRTAFIELKQGFRITQAPKLANSRTGFTALSSRSFMATTAAPPSAVHEKMAGTHWHADFCRNPDYRCCLYRLKGLLTRCCVAVRAPENTVSSFPAELPRGERG